MFSYFAFVTTYLSSKYGVEFEKYCHHNIIPQFPEYGKLCL